MFRKYICSVLSSFYWFLRVNTGENAEKAEENVVNPPALIVWTCTHLLARWSQLGRFHGARVSEKSSRNRWRVFRLSCYFRRVINPRPEYANPRGSPRHRKRPTRAGVVVVTRSGDRSDRIQTNPNTVRHPAGDTQTPQVKHQLICFLACQSARFSSFHLLMTCKCIMRTLNFNLKDGGCILIWFWLVGPICR